MAAEVPFPEAMASSEEQERDTSSPLFSPPELDWSEEEEDEEEVPASLPRNISDLTLPCAPEGDTVSASGPVIGIDLGTTFSCVAVWESTQSVVIANNMGNRTTPSWVKFEKDTVLVGEAARSKASRNPQTTVYDAKRMIGRKVSDAGIQQSLHTWPFKVAEFRGNCAITVDRGGGRPQVVTPEEVSAYVLAKMKHTAEDYLGVPVSRAVVTVPAYFNDAQRQATIDAATIADLKVERIINEPTAAALAYGLERSCGQDGAQTLLVYDLGGGTLDVTVMVVEGGIFEVKSTSGDTHLGGQDFDENLVRHFLPEVESQCGVDISGNPRALKKLRDSCQQLKHNLSHSESATMEVDALVDSEDFDTSLTREKFVEINHELFQRCLKPIDCALSDAGLTNSDINEVVLIGGSTRIVRIQQLLEEYFPGKRLSKRINPDEAVAMGAAIQGANLSLTYDQKSSKLAGITLMDVIPMSLGIELASGKMSVVIKRNTTIPYSHTRVYKNNEDYQSKAVVEVFEGEEKRARNNRLLGKFVLPGLPLRPRGKVSIPVTFTVDANGVLEVLACVSGEGGLSERLVIQKDKGLLSESEVQEKAKSLAAWERRCREHKLN